MKSILVTGAAGFIGARVCHELLQKKCRVIGLDQINDYYDPRLKRRRLSDLKKLGGQFSFYVQDVEDRRGLDRIIRKHKPAAILHLAARAGVRYSLVNPYVYVSTNTMGTLNVLESARAHGIKKFVLSSTSSLYAGESSPFSEDAPVNKPLSTYAASKKGAEALSYVYHHLYRMDVTILRYFTVYGPMGRPDMSYFHFIQNVLSGKSLPVYGDGRQKRDFTFIDDIARGTVLSMKLKGYQVINLGGGQRHRLTEMIRLIEKFLGRKAILRFLPPNPTDMKDTQAQNRKAAALLGWQPEIDFEEGMRRTVRWHVENAGWLGRLTI